MADIHPLRNFREKHDPPLSQRQFAEFLGVARETVARWETGVRRIDEEYLTDISRKTGIHPRKLRPDLAELMVAP